MNRFENAPPRAALFPVVVLCSVLLPAGCTQPAGGDSGYRVVSMTITYDAHDQRTREWNAFMKALDQCHGGGFADAQPAGPPERQCVESGPDGCRLSQARLSWDCIGMGYQPN